MNRSLYFHAERWHSGYPAGEDPASQSKTAGTAFLGCSNGRRTNGKVVVPSPYGPMLLGFSARKSRGPRVV